MVQKSVEKSRSCIEDQSKTGRTCGGSSSKVGRACDGNSSKVGRTCDGKFVKVEVKEKQNNAVSQLVNSFKISKFRIAGTHN